MQAVAPALPEFNGFWRKAKAAPMRRQGHLGAGVFFFERFHRLVEDGAAGNDGALRRSPRSELAGVRARVKIRLRFLAGHARDRPLGDDLPLKRNPGKKQRGMRVGVELAAFSAFQICIENETAAVEAL